MPLYQYVCQDCKNKWEELWSSFNEADELEPLLKCPTCQSVNKLRELGSPGVNFKGGGWTPKNNNNRNYDSSQGLIDHAKALKEEAKQLKPDDLFNGIPKPKDLG